MVPIEKETALAGLERQKKGSHKPQHVKYFFVSEYTTLKENYKKIMYSGINPPPFQRDSVFESTAPSVAQPPHSDAEKWLLTKKEVSISNQRPMWKMFLTAIPASLGPALVTVVEFKSTSQRFADFLNVYI